MTKDKLKGFNYTFYRWKHGPMSNEALQDCESLFHNGLLKEEEHAIYLTVRGSQLLKDYAELLNRNKHVLDYIRKVISEYAPYTGRKIKGVVYDLPKLGEKRLISKTELGEELLKKLTKEEAHNWFLIDDEWLETLSIVMDKEFYESLEMGIKDVKEGRVKRYQPLRKVT